MAKHSLTPVLRSLISSLLLVASASWADKPASSETAVVAEPVAVVAPACKAALKPFTAEYQSQGFGMEITIKRQLVQNTDGSWTASANTSKLFFSVNESSEFTVDNGLIKPRKHFYQQTSGGKKNRDWHFDYSKNTVTNVNPKDPWSLPLQAKAQDRFSYQLQMGLDLACRGNSTADLAYFIPDDNNYDEYRFAYLGTETLDTALGQVETVKLERSRSNNTRKDIIWLAPQWNYQMVLLRHIEKGETTDTKILSLELDGKVVKK